VCGVVDPREQDARCNDARRKQHRAPVLNRPRSACAVPPIKNGERCHVAQTTPGPSDGKLEFSDGSDPDTGERLVRKMIGNANPPHPTGELIGRARNAGRTTDRHKHGAHEMANVSPT